MEPVSASPVDLSLSETNDDTSTVSPSKYFLGLDIESCGPNAIEFTVPAVGLALCEWPSGKVVFKRRYSLNVRGQTIRFESRTLHEFWMNPENSSILIELLKDCDESEFYTIEDVTRAILHTIRTRCVERLTNIPSEGVSPEADVSETARKKAANADMRICSDNAVFDYALLQQMMTLTDPNNPGLTYVIDNTYQSLWDVSDIARGMCVGFNCKSRKELYTKLQKEFNFPDQPAHTHRPEDDAANIAWQGALLYAALHKFGLT